MLYNYLFNTHATAACKINTKGKIMIYVGVLHVHIDSAAIHIHISCVKWCLIPYLVL